MRAQAYLELIEAAPCHVDQQLVAVAEMPVGCRRAHSCPAGSFREGKAGGALLRDQFQRGADQGLFEIAMVIAAGARTSAFSRPAHVKGSYMTREGASTPPCRPRTENRSHKASICTMPIKASLIYPYDRRVRRLRPRV